MKQIRIFLPVLLFCLALFIGCKKDEDIPKTNGAFTTSKTTVTVDEEITFTNTSVNATSYTWSFGDGTTSVEASPKNLGQYQEFIMLLYRLQEQVEILYQTLR